MRRALPLLPGLLWLVLGPALAWADDQTARNFAVGPEKTVPNERVGWYVDHTAEAQRRAAELGQGLVLVLSPARCEECRDLERDVLACPAINRFAGHAVFALANPARDQAARSVMGALKVTTFPAVVMLDPASPTLAPRVQIEGYLPAGNLSLYLRDQLPISDAALPSLDDGVIAWRNKERNRPGAPQDCAVDPDGPLPGLLPDDSATTASDTVQDDGSAVEVAGSDCKSKIDEYDDLSVDCASTWPKWGTASAPVPAPAALERAALPQAEIADLTSASLYALFGYDDEVEYGRGNGRVLGLAVAAGPRALLATCHALGGHGLIAAVKGDRINGTPSGGAIEVHVTAADLAGDRCWLGLEPSEKPLADGSVIVGLRSAASLHAAEPMIAASLLQGSEFASYQVRLERIGESATFSIPDADVVLDSATAGAALFDRRGNLVGFIPVQIGNEVRQNLVLPAESFWRP